MENIVNHNKIALLQIIFALIFAAAILLSSYLLNGTQYVQHKDTVMFLLIALWFVPFTFLARKEKKTKCKSGV